MQTFIKRMQPAYRKSIIFIPFLYHKFKYIPGFTLKMKDIKK